MRWVPGEGIEPSRAEAHGFLRPARLPIPPSRPSTTSVPARRAATALLALATFALSACGRATPDPDEGPRIAFLFDGSSGDADEVTGAALAGLRFAALGTGRPEAVQPQNVGLGADVTAEMLDELAADRGIVAALVAPWTRPAAGTVERLAAAGIAVVSLTWAWGPPEDGVWRSLVIDRTREAELLLDTGAVHGAAAPACLAGDVHPTSVGLAGNVLVAAGRRGAELRPAGVVDPGVPATVSTVADRLTTFGCDAVLWTGGAATLELVLDADPELETVIGTSRLKTRGGISVAVTHPRRRLLATCGCADITLSRDPALQRFIHDYQTESGGAPGAFAVEAYDAGRLLLELAGRGGGRAAVAEELDRLDEVEGLLGTYRFGSDGALRSGPTAPGAWRAFGSRWLPLGSAPRPGVLSALSPAGVLPIVRRRAARPLGASIAHRSGGEP